MTTPILKSDIHALLSLWYRTLGLAGMLKDRDCHFHVVQRLDQDYCTYEDEVESSTAWGVEHLGYVGQELDEWFDTEDEALAFLRAKLIEMIRKEAIFQRDVQDDVPANNRHKIGEVLNELQRNWSHIPLWSRDEGE